MYRLNAHPLPTVRKITMGILAATTNFVVLGTVSALWQNPLFIRMTSTGNWEIFTLLLISLLLGLFIVIRRSSCSARSARSAGAGGVLGFLGIACPICNKLLLLLFGGEFLLTYFEPVRPYAALVGVVLVAIVTGRELAKT